MRTTYVALAALLAGAAQAHPHRAAPATIFPPQALPAQASAPETVTIDTSHVLKRFSPSQAFGAGVDGVPFHAVPEIYTPANVRKMLASGLGPISYRLYTELSVQDWHWNPVGQFSEAGDQGYWTSSATPGAPTVDTFGYRLPHRGFTHDQGNDDDYSRLDDGDPATYWKSNPYLTQSFTHEDDTLHPQWVLLDLGKAHAIDAARIAWAAPYARHYAVQYWTGGDPIYDPAHGNWQTYPGAEIANGAGGISTLPLGAAPAAQYVRILMSQSSNTCDTHDASDPRNCVGYAIGEVGLGTVGANGVFTDLVRHAPNQKQTTTYASSVDPWHSAANRVRDQEQPGLDIVFSSGVTRGLPATIPVPMLYSTPENAAAEIAYVEAQGYKIARVEMGEEPDGEYVGPEDDAALYTQFADALHAVDPKLQLGGPVFQSNLTDVKAWPDANGETSWTKRFLAYLTAHDHLAAFNFFSFEHYPFTACGNARTQENLLREPALVQHIIDVWRNDGLPPRTPIFITETSYSQNETDAAQQPAGAIWYADLLGSTLSAGGDGVFFYEYEPIPLSPSNPCPGWGSYGLLLGDQRYTARAPLSQFFAAKMLTTNWAPATDASHTLFGATLSGTDGWVNAYPLQRPDGSWGVLLVNRDLAHPHQVRVRLTGDGITRYLAGAVTQTSFGSEQYHWIQAGPHSHPNPDGPSTRALLEGKPNSVYVLPKASINVLEGSAKIIGG